MKNLAKNRGPDKPKDHHKQTTVVGSLTILADRS